MGSAPRKDSMRTFLMAGLLLALALAGCSGGGDSSDTQSVSTSTQTGAGNTTVSGSVSAGPGGAAGNASVNGTSGNASAATSWSHDNRTGSISGNGAIVNVPFTKDESFTVRDGVSRLLLNLTVEGNELTMKLRSPDCSSDDCAEQAQTSSGQASLDVSRPGPGEWLVTLELTGTGPVQSDYTLEIAQQGPKA